MTGGKCSEAGTGPGVIKRSGRQGWHSTRSGSAWLFSAALWPGSPLYPPRTLQDGGMAGESASAPELEPTRAPQEPDSHHALSLRFERYPKYPKYLYELSRIEFVSEENGEEVASSDLVRVTLVLAALWHGSAYSISSSISSPLPKGGGDDGYRHSKKCIPPTLPPRLKGPQYSHRDLTEGAKNISEKSQPQVPVCPHRAFLPVLYVIPAQAGIQAIGIPSPLMGEGQGEGDIFPCHCEEAVGAVREPPSDEAISPRR